MFVQLVAGHAAAREHEAVSPRRILAIAFKETLQVWRDPRSLAIALLMPLMQMVLLGYGVSLDIKRVPLCIYDQENSQTSRELVERFVASGWFAIRATLDSDRVVREAMDRGACIGAVDHSGRFLARSGERPAPRRCRRCSTRPTPTRPTSPSATRRA